MHKSKSVTICNYLKDNGVLCGSPALRGQDRCYFHVGLHDRPTVFIANPFQLPIYTNNPLIEQCVFGVLAQLRSGELPAEEARPRLNAILVGNNILRKIQRNLRPKPRKTRRAVMG